MQKVLRNLQKHITTVDEFSKITRYMISIPNSIVFQFTTINIWIPKLNIVLYMVIQNEIFRYKCSKIF
jgi:hypothetical protein